MSRVLVHRGRDLRELDMLRAMGHELANIHLGTRGVKKTIRKDLDRHPVEFDGLHATPNAGQ